MPINWTLSANAVKSPCHKDPWFWLLAILLAPALVGAALLPF